MKKVPKGKLTTINELRTTLAKKHKTDFICPITTGIFSWIAAYAEDELAQQGRKRITPTGARSRATGRSFRSTSAASRPSAENSKPRAKRRFKRGQTLPRGELKKRQSSRNRADVLFSRLLRAWPSGLDGVLFIRSFLLLICLAGLPRLDAPALDQADAPPVNLKRSEALSQQHCDTCHLFPEPALLDKKTWSSQVMPRIAIRLGLPPKSINRHPEAEVLWKIGKFPKAPTIPVADYQAIAAYYQAKAPAQPIAQKPLAPIGPELPQFTAKPSQTGSAGRSAQ